MIAKAKKKVSKFQRWYKENGDELNRRRREKYAKDKKYRKKQLENTQRSRKNAVKIPRAVVPKTKFSIGEAAEEMGCAIETIRNLEGAGLIPAASSGTGHRRYTLYQINLMKNLVDFRKDNHYKSDGYDKEVAKLSKHIHQRWGK